MWLLNEETPCAKAPRGELLVEVFSSPNVEHEFAKRVIQAPAQIQLGVFVSYIGERTYANMIGKSLYVGDL